MKIKILMDDRNVIRLVIMVVLLAFWSIVVKLIMLVW